MTRTRITAAVLNTPGSLDFESLDIDEPGAFEVRVRPVSVGLCHSDLHYIDGTHRTDLPEVLGHEAAGVVESVGAGVDDIVVGDHVVTSLTQFCGTCRYCTSGRMSLCANRNALRRRSSPALVNQAGRSVARMGGIGAFAEMLLIHRNGVVVIPPSLPFDIASLFGCAVLTGIGAVMRSARVEPGSTVAVIGCGGVGLAVIQGAQLAGAARIIAVDLSPDKLQQAKYFGATDLITSSDTAAADVLALSRGGVDYSFEAIGKQATAELAIAMLAPGGTCTILGMVPDDTPVRVTPSDLYFHEKRIQGAFIGSSRFTEDVPHLIDLYGQGRLKLDGMISHHFEFSDLEKGFAELAAGRVSRAVLDVNPHGTAS